MQRCVFALTFFLLLLNFLAFNLQAAEENAVPVTSQPLSELLKYPVQSAPATVESLNRSQLSARLNAQIVRIPVKVGDIVSKGTVLVELDCRDAQLALQQEQSRLTFAQHQLKRSRALHKNRNVSDELLNQRQMDAQLIELAIRQQQLAVSRCQVKAPFNGVVVARYAAEGELAVPGTRLLSLLDTDRVEVVASVLLDQVGEVAETEARWFEAQGKHFSLTLRAIVDEINTQARNRVLRFDFPEAPALPGSPGRLKWQAANPLLPAEYLVRRKKGIGVFVLENNRARFVILKDAKEGQAAVIDLPVQTRIIIDGRFSLRNNDLVKNIDQKPNS